VRVVAVFVVRAVSIIAAVLAAILCLQEALAFPTSDGQTALPAGTELNEDALDIPREVFHSEATGGQKSYLINLGNLAFNSPDVLGTAAQQGGISCGTCHVNGASNPKLFIPGLSTRPGNFDTTSGLFNPHADNATLDPVRIPSLRGARYLAPYGNDGRMASLRDFVRNVIVDEFAGPEPSPAILDAIVAYIQDIDFIPNPSLAASGKLIARASDAERRGEVLFSKPFPHDPALSCATCHIPSAAFVDHQQHDVGSGGLFKTPTLLNADFNAPYFHDGRFDTFDQVVSHFDSKFNLGLSQQDKRDLVAYLTAVGDGVQANERSSSVEQIQDITDFSSVLGPAISTHDNNVIALATITVSGLAHDLADEIPDLNDSSVSGGEKERGLARRALEECEVILKRIGSSAASGKYDEAATEYALYNRMMTIGVPTIVGNAEPWSLFSPAVHDAHYAALRKRLQAKKQSAPSAN
jgi:cytochrome c peroxidase